MHVLEVRIGYTLEKNENIFMIIYYFSCLNIIKKNSNRFKWNNNVLDTSLNCKLVRQQKLQICVVFDKK